MPAVRVEGVTVGYGGPRPALAEVSLAAAAGQLVAVTGPSGAGKTTLLRTIAGWLRPEQGQVTLDGVPLRGQPDAVARRVVLVPQDNGLAEVLTAAENVAVPLLAAGWSPARAYRAATEALAALGLDGQADQLVEELSGGQQQRTALARGLAQRGEVLLADEVTSELDLTNRRRVLQLLRAEADRGAAVVFATHDPQAAAACDVELPLLDGRVSAGV